MSPGDKERTGEVSGKCSIGYARRKFVIAVQCDEETSLGTSPKAPSLVPGTRPGVPGHPRRRG